MSNALLSALSLGSLVSVFNCAVEDHSLPVNPVTKFASKAAGVARIEKLVEEYGLEVREVNDYVALVALESQDDVAPEGWTEAGGPTDQVENPHAASNALISAAIAAGDLDLPEVTEVELTEELPAEADEPAAEAPFVKLSKAELDALGERGSPAREAYRKARRAAARAARKAKAE